MKLAEWLLSLSVFAAAAVLTAIFAPVDPFTDATLGGFIFAVFGVVAVTLTLALRSR